MITPKNPLDYVEKAKELTGSNDIDIILDAARKLAQFDLPAPAYPPVLPQRLSDFLPTVKITHPLRGLIPFDPYPFQSELAWDLNRTVMTRFSEPSRLVHVGSRQMGTSTLLSAFALWYALNNAKQKILFVVPRLTFGFDISERIGTMLVAQPMTYGQVVQNNKAKKTFSNGSTIDFRTYASEVTPRDIAASDIVILSDAAYCPYAYDNSIRTALFELLARNGTYVASSNPQHPRGIFWDLWNEAKSHEKLYQPWHVHPERDEEWARPFREQLGPKRFANEFECEFINKAE